MYLRGILSYIAIFDFLVLVFGNEQNAFSLQLSENACPIDIPWTCSNSTPIYDSCCFESPGGIFLQTQFWDYYPPIGGNESFTLHGLWPDNCDGSYEQFCDDSINIKSAKSVVVGQFNDIVLYEKMESNWKNFNGDDESLWVHEFNKHGTCVKTIRPKCYGDYIDNQNVLDYYNATVDVYEKLPTFKFLEEAGIIPSTDKTYSKQEIANALAQGFGGNQVYFKCNKYNALQEIWYYHYLHGSLRSHNLKPIPSLLNSNCPENDIKFLPKTGWKPPPSRPGPSPPSGPDRGYIRISDHRGCVISNGHWYQYGTCATFHIFKSTFGGYNLKSSKGFCGVTETGEFSCNRSFQPSRYQFQIDKKNGVISYGGTSKWCFNKDGSHGPGRYKQTPIVLDKEGGCDESFELRFT